MRLAENKSLAFEGSKLQGTGFLISPEKAKTWLALDPGLEAVLAPYLGGEDVNSRPDLTAPRWAIDFRERSENESSKYSRAWEHVTTHVRPDRMKKDAKKYPRMVNEWWKYWNARASLYAKLESRDEVLVIAVTSKTVMPVRVRTGHVFANTLDVFLLDAFADQAILSSSAHQLWAITYGSGMKGDPRYTPSDVFETFPRPEQSSCLETVGRALEEERRAIMLRRQLGLTALYNLANDASVDADKDVQLLRDIHVQLDEAVMAAYRWEDIPLDHGFHTYRGMERFTVSPAARVEILDRLLELNHERARAEGQDVPDQGELF